VLEVLLRKQKVEVTKSATAAKLGNETRVRMGQVGVAKPGGEALYVVDGIIMPTGADINPDDVEGYTILQGPAAVAIFGAEGSNGAIVITTRKGKTKSLDTVFVSSGYLNKALSGRTGGVNLRTKVTKYTDIKTRINTIFTDSLKIYPNPVQRGDQINISLKLKQTGNHNIQIADATGRIVLQKQINAVTKGYTEKIPTDSRWSSGVYYIRVFDKSNKFISTNSFIVR
jgi:TonB-dependent SusC/RagA subfamily outer membrane receptor